jgi:hypothetical protein
MIKSRGMRWAAHVAFVDERRHAYIKSWWETLKVTAHSNDLDIDGRILPYFPARKTQFFPRKM